MGVFGRMKPDEACGVLSAVLGFQGAVSIGKLPFVDVPSA